MYACVCLFHPMCAASCGGPKRILDPLELELQAAVIYNICNI